MKFHFYLYSGGSGSHFGIQPFYGSRWCCIDIRNQIRFLSLLVWLVILVF